MSSLIVEEWDLMEKQQKARTTMKNKEKKNSHKRGHFIFLRSVGNTPEMF